MKKIKKIRPLINYKNNIKLKSKKKMGKMIRKKSKIILLKNKKDFLPLVKKI